jgi:hypothetical protein
MHRERAKRKNEVTADDPQDAASRAIERLYEAPLEDFVRLRREAAAELRKANDKVGASRIADVAKPSRATWAINQVARRNAKVLTAMIDARRAAEQAQRAGGADRIHQALAAYRARTSDVVHAARDMLEEAGIQANAALLRQIADALRAASAEEGPMQAQLVGGQLEREVPEAEADLVAALDTGTRAAPKSGEDAAKKRRDDRAAALEEARPKALARKHAEALELAERRVKALEQAAERAREAAEKARANADEARTALKKLERGDGC